MANTFTFANQTLTDANIFGGISYIVDLNANDEFNIGNTASASVSFTTDIQLPLYSKDAVNGTFTWTQDNVGRGRYYIIDVLKSAGMYTVTAYDAMMLLEKPATELGLTFPVTVAGAASAIASYIGCTISGSLVNSGLSIDALDDGTTIRQLLSFVAEASGCSVKIDGSDQICLLYYEDSGLTITASQYKEIEVADYTCDPIDKVVIFNRAGLIQAEAGTGTNTLYIKGLNPFFDNATNANAENILAVVEDFEYAPLKCQMFEENGVEVGTIVTFGTTPTLVMHIESSEMGATAASYGSDTRADYNKDISELLSEVTLIANDAKEQVEDALQNFWFTATDTGAGAGVHITEVKKDDYLDPESPDYLKGGSALVNSKGIFFRDREGTNFVEFNDLRGADGTYDDAVEATRDLSSSGYVTRNEQRVYLTFRARSLDDITVNLDGTPFTISDQSYRYTYSGTTSSQQTKILFTQAPASGAQITVNYAKDGTGTLYTETITADGTNTSYNVGSTHSGRWVLVHVYIDNVEIPGIWFQQSYIWIYGEYISDGDPIVIEYKTDSYLAKTYTLGWRDEEKKAGANSFCTGKDVAATGLHGAAFGSETEAGKYAFACGRESSATGDISHVEGMENTASGYSSHAEGWGNTASADDAHAEGYHCTASGDHSHAQGYNTTATRHASFAAGEGTVASGMRQTVIGRYNIEDTGTYAFIIGCGYENEEDNALTVDWYGNVRAKGLIQDTIKEIVPGITRSSGGTVSNQKICLTGHLAQLNLTVTYSTSVNAGGDLFNGELSDADYYPHMTTYGCGYYGAHAIVAILRTDGTITVRNASSSAVTVSSGVGVSLTYVL